MTDFAQIRSNRGICAAAWTSALVIFALDIFSPLQGAVAVLYTTTVLIATRSTRRLSAVKAGVSCAVLAIAGYAISHGHDPLGSPALRLTVSLFAIAMATALTMRHRTVRDSLAEQARMLELTHDTVIVRDLDDRILYWNEDAERLYGWTRAEAIGQPAHELLQTDAVETAQAVLERDGTWAGEISRARKDGTRIILESRWLARFDTLGRLTGIFETSADVTEQRAEVLARRQSEERYQTIFHAAGFPIMEMDLSRVKPLITPGHVLNADAMDLIADSAIVTDANQAAAEFFGVECVKNLIGRSLARFHTPGSSGAHNRILEALGHGDRFIEVEMQYLLEDGARVDAVLRLTLPEGDDNWERLLVLALNVTDRYRMQRRLAQAQSELTEVGRVTTLGQVAAYIAHEVNQPLTAIVAFASSGKRWLAKEAPDATEVADCLEKISISSTRAAEVIARVRSLFRKGGADFEPIQFSGLINATTALLERELRETDIKLRMSIETDLPLVGGDRVLLQQVLVNLILNAEQAMAETPPDSRELAISARRHQDGVMVEVADSRSGLLFDPSEIFEPFFSSRNEGMGMGLSISRSIIEQHGGSLEGANRPNGGAAFSFIIPTSTLESAH